MPWLFILPRTVGLQPAFFTNLVNFPECRQTQNYARQIIILPSANGLQPLLKWNPFKNFAFHNKIDREKTNSIYMNAVIKLYFTIFLFWNFSKKQILLWKILIQILIWNETMKRHIFCCVFFWYLFHLWSFPLYSCNVTVSSITVVSLHLSLLIQ